jgi:hypothetical protein
MRRIGPFCFVSVPAIRIKRMTEVTKKTDPFQNDPHVHDAMPLAADVLIGAQAIADEIGIDVRQCFHWLQNKHIPATKTGATWTTTRSALRRHFGGAAA